MGRMVLPGWIVAVVVAGCAFNPGAAQQSLVQGDMLLVKNDYRESGYPRNDGDPATSIIALSGASNCTVFESGEFPPDQGGAAFHVSHALE